MHHSFLREWSADSGKARSQARRLYAREWLGPGDCLGRDNLAVTMMHAVAGLLVQGGKEQEAVAGDGASRTKRISNRAKYDKLGKLWCVYFPMFLRLSSLFSILLPSGKPRDTSARSGPEPIVNRLVAFQCQPKKVKSVGPQALLNSDA